MADVYLAFDRRRMVQVAIKILREDLAEDPDFLRRFAREAQALARLDHPNIVRFFSFEREGLTAFIVLEYVDGVTLRRRLAERGGPLGLDETTAILRQIASALHYAHNEGFIHRDLKPGNVMIDKHGRALLTDFGIAKALESATVTTMAVGTPAYMSPEQILGQELDVRTDIYSLGVMLFQMVTGRRPFTGEEPGLTGTGTLARLRDAHLHATPPRPSELNPVLPPEVDEVILRALAKKREERWQDVVALLRAWEAAVGEEPTVVMPRPTLEAATPVSFPQPPMTAQIRNVASPEASEMGGGRRWLPWLAVGVVTGIAAILFILLGSRYGEANKSGSTEIVSSENLRILREVKTPTPASQVHLQKAPQATQIIGTKSKSSFSSITTPTLTATSTSTYTPTPTNTPVPTATPTPEPDAGATKISSRDNMEMVYVPAGEFLMGSTSIQIQEIVEECAAYGFKRNDCEKWFGDEIPQHTVYLDSFWIDKAEVTNVQYQRCVAAGVCSSPVDFGDRFNQFDQPVVGVNWYDAQAYCEWVGRRLPTEAEWEKAARGMDGRIFPWGDAWDVDRMRRLNFADKKVRSGHVLDDGYAWTAPVGSYPAGQSPYGALDMAGNVWEWVADYYRSDYYSHSPTRNPDGPNRGNYHVIRGGSWVNATSWNSVQPTVINRCLKRRSFI